MIHHFDAAGCVAVMRKAHAALAAGGRVVAVEFMPDESRVSPPVAARFALVMLCSTPSGDAHTFAEYEGMFREAGFSRIEGHGLPMLPQRVAIATR